MIATAIAFVSPAYVLFNVALKPESDNSGIIVPAAQPTLANFAAAWTDANLANALVNTTVVTALSLLIIVVASSMAGYAIARSTSRLGRWTYGAFLLGLLLPFQLAAIPLYQLMQRLGLLGSLWGLVAFYSALLLPFSIFLYAAFLRTLPREYEEAAEVDGAGPLATFFRVVFPMMRAVTGTVVILNAINIWNDFFTPQLYLTGSGTQTLTVSLYAYVGQYSTEWPLIFGGLIIASAPILVLFFFLQRHVIQGFAGGLKG